MGKGMVFSGESYYTIFRLTESGRASKDEKLVEQTDILAPRRHFTKRFSLFQ